MFGLWLFSRFSPPLKPAPIFGYDLRLVREQESFTDAVDYIFFNLKCYKGATLDIVFHDKTFFLYATLASV